MKRTAAFLLACAVAGMGTAVFAAEEEKTGLVLTDMAEEPMRWRTTSMRPKREILPTS